ncbi:A/G-specific adenine glycosylase [Chitinophaga horti]|uniref:Adenine DNA glycosylase n=1 Tax=Chitinophaga horti TaxID=2920382 RepID=A0ABY6J3V4_9BACT|nr:A/G-specific adenine glycosylase [Chitinophaga horti]UYQ93011.1 A/G-specific adenine glycosylase [Chitinophaga horti]
MPWKGEKDPYRIWLSEIILQQTRVEQGWPYYERFTTQYPTVLKLAAAADEEVFRLWQGLGYYARCKNMLAAAREVAAAYQGKFPDTYEGIVSLKGVGAYTAAAIASFAFNLPHAVLDGNVYRVLARYFNIDTPIDSTAGKKLFTALADDMLPKNNAAEFNQSIMDFGAVVCKPQSPDCPNCPLNSHCEAYATGTVGELPVKTKKLKIKKRHFNYLVMVHDGYVYIRKRVEKDIWQNLHELVLLETTDELSPGQLALSQEFKKLTGKYAYQITQTSPLLKQQLTHQTIFARFIHLQFEKELPPLDGFMAVPISELYQYAFPKTIVSYLESLKWL